MVCPYLFRMKTSEVTGPLTEFQASLANREDTHKLIITLNKAMKEKALPEGKLTQAFDRWWPDLEKSLGSIPASAPTKKPARSSEEMIEEVLNIVRDQARVTQITQQMIDDLRRAGNQNSLYNSLYSILPSANVLDSSMGASYPLNSLMSNLDYLKAISTLQVKPIDLESPLRADDEESSPDPEWPVRPE